MSKIILMSIFFFGSLHNRNYIKHTKNDDENLLNVIAYPICLVDLIFVCVCLSSRWNFFEEKNITLSNLVPFVITKP